MRLCSSTINDQRENSARVYRGWCSRSNFSAIAPDTNCALYGWLRGLLRTRPRECCARGESGRYESSPLQARARPACEWRRSMPRGWAKPPRSPSESRATAACSSHCRRSAPSRARTEAERVLPLRRPDQLCSSDGCCRGRSSCSPRHAYALPLELSAEERPSWCSRTRRPQARALGRAGGTDGASRVPCDCILRYDAIREVT